MPSQTAESPAYLNSTRQSILTHASPTEKDTFSFCKRSTAAALRAAERPSEMT